LRNVVAGLPRTDFYVPGSVLGIELDMSNPIAAGMPKEQLDAVVEHLKRLRQLAVSATETLMRQAISDETEAAARANLATLTTTSPPKSA